MIEQVLYEKILDCIPICCVDIIVTYNKKVLIIRRANKPAQGKWWVPGGRILKGETLKEAVKRKALDELGLEVEVLKMVGVYETLFNDAPFNLSSVHTINIVFVVKPATKSFSISLNKEATDFKWISQVSNNLDEYIKRILNDSNIFNCS